jgi:N-carbamoylputrescine amidase
MRCGVIQQAWTGDRDSMIAASEAGIRAVASQGADLVVLQELHCGSYFCQQEDSAVFDQAETVPGPGTNFFGALAAELGVVIVGSFFERRAPGLYHNTAVVCERDGSIAGRFRKMHIPDDPGFYEKFYFTPGDLGFEPIDTSAGRLGVLICWDQWYPEAARLMALAGAELLIYPTAIGWDMADDDAERTRQRDAWITVQRGHAVANGLPLIAVNRVGHEEDPAGGRGIRFWGSSFACGPQGEILYQAATEQPATAVVDIDLGRAEQVRRNWPFLRDRRIDAYEPILQRWLDR